jgi:hypothetical protein
MAAAGERPYYADEPPSTQVVPVPIAKIRRRVKED